MADTNACDWELIEAPDTALCLTSNTALITEAIYGNPGYPIVLPVANAPGETNESRFSREVVRRLALTTGNERLQRIKGLKATWPFPTPQFKVNPNNGQRFFIPEDTDLKVEGTEYRYHKSLYAFYQSASNGKPQMWLFRVGKELIVGDVDKTNGTASGVVATMTAIPGVVDEQNVSHQIKYSFDWKGDLFADRYAYNF